MKKPIQTAIVAALLALSNPAMAQDKTHLTMGSNPAGSTIGQFGIAFSQVTQKYAPVDIQVSVGKPATKLAVDAATEKLDLFITAASINHFMQTGTAMFSKVENSAELNSNLRGIINYALGPYQIVVYEDSGIRSVKDFRGKKVFLGPPAGAATKVATNIVEAVSGLKPGEDFEVMRFDWKSAETAFLDRQMDVFIIPTVVPSPSVQQFGLTNEIRILGITDDAWDHPAMKASLDLPGRTKFTIQPGDYQNLTNTEAVKTIGSWVGIGTHKWMDEDVVYQMIKAFWEHTDEVYATADWLKEVTPETALNEMNIPLHAGAHRYYVEAGWNVPDELRPPEAQ